MPAEAPQQIDLNQDLQTQGIQLSPDQQEKYESFLNKLEEQEKQDIIYLTQQELGEFKRLLDGDDSAYQNADFDEFIDEQREEGYYSTELLGKKLEGMEQFEGIGELCQEVLFNENEGILSSLDISTRAQESLSAALSIATIEHLGTSELTVDTNIMAEITQVMGEGLGELKSLADARQVLGQTSTIPQLQISGNGENNTIFMDPNLGKDFFLQVLSGEYDINTMESELENANQDSPVEEIQLGELSEEIKQHASELVEKIQALQSDDSIANADLTADDVQDLVDDTEISESENKGIMRFLENLLKMFGLDKLFEGVAGGNDTNQTNPEDNPDEPGEIAPENIAKNNKLIEMIDNLSSANQDFVNKLKGDAGSVDKIRLILEGVSTEQTFEETFEEVFNSEDVLSSNGIRAGKTFEDYGFLESLPDGQSQIQQCIKMLEEYSRYRNSDGVRDLTSGRTTWQAWAEKRQAENWRVGGR